jgi:DNA helicase-2/ATP-dependent DNA helicase PcrA
MIRQARFKDSEREVSDLDGDRTVVTSYRSQVKDGDFLLCRVNAPLVSECFRFLRQGRKANIQGRDIGAGLIRTVKKLLPNDSERMVNGSTVKLVAALSDWLHAETSKENAKRNPNEQRLIALQDKHDCICCFTEGQATAEGVIRKIESVFTDDKNGVGIRLSSVHKAKGLESDRVFILMPEGAGMPHPMAKSEWEREAELNCLYVAITRAKLELVYVS